jgi:hypothetical protein
MSPRAARRRAFKHSKTYDDGDNVFTPFLRDAGFMHNSYKNATVNQVLDQRFWLVSKR